MIKQIQRWWQLRRLERDEIRRVKGILPEFCPLSGDDLLCEVEFANVPVGVFRPAPGGGEKLAFFDEKTGKPFRTKRRLVVRMKKECASRTFHHHHRWDSDGKFEIWDGGIKYRMSRCLWSNQK